MKIAEINTQADAVIYFLQQMDVEMVNDVLDDTLIYQEFPKYKFINKLSAAIEKLRDGGDVFLNCFPGKCQGIGCDNHGCSGFPFIGNRTGDYINMIVEIKSGKVMDMYECNHFKIEQKSIKWRNQVQIDEKDLPF